MKLQDLINKWEEFNNFISEEDDFDEEAFAELYGKSEETFSALRCKTEFSKDDLILFFELTRFIFKEIYSDEQEECQEKIRGWLDAIMYLPRL